MVSFTAFEPFPDIISPFRHSVAMFRSERVFLLYLQYGHKMRFVDFAVYMND